MSREKEENKIEKEKKERDTYKYDRGSERKRERVRQE